MRHPNSLKPWPTEEITIGYKMGPIRFKIITTNAIEQKETFFVADI